MGSDKARPAYVEDVEGEEDSDNNRTVRGTRVSASSSSKEKKRRSEKRASKARKANSDDGYSSLVVPTRADESATVKQVRVIPDRDVREGRRKSISASQTKSPRKSSRPPAQRNVTFDHADLPTRPKDRDDPRYFGERGGHSVVIQSHPGPRPPPPTSSASSAQSRSQRPISGQLSRTPRPPLSGSAFYSQPTYAAAPIMIQPSYQNPMQASYLPVQPSSPSRRTLMDRFARTGAAIVRPSSVSGYRSSDIQGYERGSEYEYESASEEQSQADFIQDAIDARDAREAKEAKRRAKERKDTEDMPPPQLIVRRRSVRQPSEQSVFFPDNQEDEPRRSRDYDRRPSRDYDEHERQSRRRSSHTTYEFDERPPQPKIMYRGDTAPPRPRRKSLPRAPQSDESSFDYDQGDANIRVEAASGRRASYYGGLSAPSSTYEEKVRDATGYQANISGGEPIKLTADLLRKQQNTIGSSRSTRSSDSRDESDFKRSVTTRTTRSVSGPDADGDGDDVTIRIKGNAKVKIGAAEITNADGVELNIVNNRRQSIRNGSEASRSEYAPSQPSEYAPTATDERERERERRGRDIRHDIRHGGRERAASQAVRRPRFF